MKKYIWNCFVNGLIIVVALTVVFKGGLKESFAYNDSGSASLDIYSTSNVVVESIEGTQVSGKPIRVQDSKGYNNLVLTIDGETLTLNDGFSFNNSAGSKQSMVIYYDVNEDALFLDRSFEFLSGYQTLPLTLLAAALINALALVVNLAMISESRKEQTNVYQISIVHHLKNSIDSTILFLFASFGLWLLLSNMFYDLRMVAYNLSDPTIIFGAVSLLLIIFVFTFIYQTRKHNLRIIFEGSRMRVEKGNTELFSAAIDDVVYQETMIRNVNTFMTKDYTALNLQLKSKETGVVGIDLNLLPFGEPVFKSIRSKLRDENDRILNQDIMPSMNDNEPGSYTVQARKTKDVWVLSIGLLIALIVGMPLMVIGIVSSNISDAIVVFMVIVIPLIIIIIYGVMISKLMKPITFDLSYASLRCDGLEVSSSEIKSIRLSYPAEASGHVRGIDIRTEYGRKKWQLPGKRLGDKGMRNDMEYTRLYHAMREFYKDKVQDL